MVAGEIITSISFWERHLYASQSEINTDTYLLFDPFIGNSNKIFILCNQHGYFGSGWYIGPLLIAYEFCVLYWRGNVFVILLVELHSNCYDNWHTRIGNS